jgi:hypothetical protein
MLDFFAMTVWTIGTLLSEANVAQELSTKSALSACCVVNQVTMIQQSKMRLHTRVRVPDNRDAKPKLAIVALSFIITPHL